MFDIIYFAGGKPYPNDPATDNYRYATGYLAALS